MLQIEICNIRLLSFQFKYISDKLNSVRSNWASNHSVYWENSLYLLLLIFPFIVIPTLIEPIVFPRLVFLLVLVLPAITIIVISNIEILLYNKAHRRVIRICLFLFFLYFALLTLSLSQSDNFSLALFGSYGRNLGYLHYLITITAIAAGFVLGNLTRSSVPSYIKLLFWSTLAQVLLGLIQISGLKPFGISSSYNPVIGTFANPNYYSQFVGLGAVVVLLKIKQNYPILKLLILCLSFIVLVSNNSIQSFAIIFCIYLPLILIHRFRRIFKNLKLLKVFFTISAFITLFLCLLTIASKYSKQLSLEYRFNYLKVAFRMLEDNPLLGVGIDHFGIFFNEYQDSSKVMSGTIPADNAHSLIPHIFATQGLAAGIIFTLICMIILYTAFILFFNSRKNTTEFILSLFVVGFIVSSQFSIENQPTAIYGWLGGGLVLSCVFRTFETSQNNANRLTKKTKSRISDRTSRAFSRAYVSIFIFVSLALFLIFLPRIDQYRLSSAEEIKNQNVSKLLESSIKLYDSRLNILALKPEPYLFYNVALRGVNASISNDVSGVAAIQIVRSAQLIVPNDINLMNLEAQIIEYQGNTRLLSKLTSNIAVVYPNNYENRMRRERLSRLIDNP